MSNSDIKKFIDFFYEAAQKIRNTKPVIIHGKDGRLVKLALKKLREDQLEQLTIWFLEKKKSLSTTIGAMLSNKVLETLAIDMDKEGFWKELGNIYDRYFPRPSYPKELLNKLEPFTHKQITEIQEEVASLTRSRKRR